VLPASVFELANSKNAIVRVYVTTTGDKIYSHSEEDAGELAGLEARCVGLLFDVV